MKIEDILSYLDDTFKKEACLESLGKYFTTQEVRESLSEKELNQEYIIISGDIWVSEDFEKDSINKNPIYTMIFKSKEDAKKKK